MPVRWFDTSKHPLHVLEFPAAYTFEELDAQMVAMRDEYRRLVMEHPQDLCVIVVDLSRVEQSQARNRKRIADGIGELTDLMAKRIVAQAYVIHRPLIHAALTALTWLQTSPWPVRVFSQRAAAEAWLSENLDCARSRSHVPTSR